jgi:hypothetical protein
MWDLAGHYLPTSGAFQTTPAEPSLILGARFPGLRNLGAFGTSLQLVARTSAPLSPVCDVDLAFRSQRIVTTLSAGTTGRTVEATQAEDGSVSVTNTLPVELQDVWVARTRTSRAGARSLVWDAAPILPSGATVVLQSTRGKPAWLHDRPATTPDEVPYALTTAFWSPDRPAPNGLISLLRAGIALPPPGDRAGSGAGVEGFLIATAASAPFPLGDDRPGTTRVILVKEVRFP